MPLVTITKIILDFLLKDNVRKEGATNQHLIIATVTLH